MKVGDWVFHKNNGWKKIEYVCHGTLPLYIEGDCFDLDGKYNTFDRFPTLLLHNPFDPEDRPLVNLRKGRLSWCKMYLMLYGKWISSKKGV